VLGAKKGPVSSSARAARGSGMCGVLSAFYLEEADRFRSHLGVLFIGATVADRRFRAFDIRTGKLLWDEELPFAGMATPSTYMVDGKQYVVIASSGGRDPKGPIGGMYIAFALPSAK